MWTDERQATSSHLQAGSAASGSSPTDAGVGTGAADKRAAQLRHLDSWIPGVRDPDLPVVAMGDFDIDVDETAGRTPSQTIGPRCETCGPSTRCACPRTGSDTTPSPTTRSVATVPSGGTRSKTVLTGIDPVEIEVPKDTESSFEPKIVRKRQRRLTGIDEIVLSFGVKGLGRPAVGVWCAVGRARSCGSR